LAVRERQLFNLIDLDEPDKGVQIWDFSFHLFGKQLDKEIRNSEPEDGYEDFSHLERGLTLRLGIGEKSFNGRPYYEVETINFRKRKEPYDEDILEQTHCLDDVLILLDYDKLKAILLQDDEPDDEEDEEEKPERGRRKKPEPEPEEEDDEDDWVDDEEEEEEPAPPPKKKKASKKKTTKKVKPKPEPEPEEEEDDEDDWFDDEEEDE
jgi:hypothetical protein